MEKPTEIELFYKLCSQIINATIRAEASSSSNERTTWIWLISCPIRKAHDCFQGFLRKWSGVKQTADSVVDHVLGCCTELLVSLDDLVHCIKEVFLCHSLSPCSDGKHASFCAHTPYIGTWERNSCQKTNALSTNIPLA